MADDILVKTPAGTDFLEIKQLRLKPYLWALLRKKFNIKEIEMESPRLAIKRKTTYGVSVNKPSSAATLQSLRSEDTKVMSSRCKFRAMANWILSTDFMCLFRIRFSAFIISSAVTSRIVIPRVLMP